MRTRAARTAATGAVVLACVLGLGAVTYGSSPSSSSSPSSPSSSSSPASGSEQAATTSTPDLAEPQTSADDVEVSTYGVITVRTGQRATNPPVTMALHAVQRVEGGTVVYYSAGQAENTADVTAISLTDIRDPTRGSTVAFGSVRITDVAGGMAYRSVPHPDGGYFISGPPSYPDDTKGTMGVLYAVLPELAAETTTVNVELLNGQTIADVPVGEGYLEPTMNPDEVIPLGTGWPQIDPADVARIDGASWSYPLITTTEALDNSQVETEQGQTVTIDVAADVLFAFDRADLSPVATARITEIASTVAEDGATGTLSIIGHTDNQGDDSYNIDLSDRRAAAVAAVLQPALSSEGLTFAVEGRGEAEPIASNSSEEGRQANRRVTITYTKGG